jgi:hypothetical protein
MTTSKAKSELAKHEEERKEGFNRIAIGGVSRNGKKIYDVYAKGDDYAIYAIDSDRTINGMRTLIAASDPDDESPIENFQAVKAELDQLKEVSYKTDNPSYTTRVAQALSVAICGEPEKARSILTGILNSINQHYRERVIGKLVYVLGTLSVSLVICSIGMYLYICQPEFFVNDRKPLYELIMVCSFATLGGIVSVTRNINSINIDKGLGYLPYFVYGISRNIFSILGGVFIYLVIKSNLLFGFIDTLDNSLYALLAFGFVAGFSETLVPNALKKLEDKANSESNE